MDREGFRNRLNQYKKAREENPGLKYWEWKNIPKYDEGGEVEPDPLEVLERSRPKVAGIPINDKPFLNRAYTVEPDLDTPAARAARKPSEKRATNVNIRHKLQTDLRNTLGHNPTKAEMDKFIDSLSD